MKLATYFLAATCFFLSTTVAQSNAVEVPKSQGQTRTIEIPFKSFDGLEMFGKLTLPNGGEPAAIVIYVQTAEGATVDIKRRKSATETFNYLDLYREKLADMNVGFFSYEGRGIRMGDKPPRFEQIDWDEFNTGTLDAKVRDVISAIATVRAQSGLNSTRLFLLGSSEGTLLAAEAASRAPDEVAGLVLYGVLATNMRQNFRYIMTEGAFLPFRINFDTDGDGKVTKAEYEADPHQFREKTGLKVAGFEALDKTQDGYFSADDIVALRTKKFVDAIDSENYEVLQEWAKTSAAVAVPKDWFKDHFAHETIWTFLSKLDIPVGCFHGGRDAMASIEELKKLEAQAKAAGKSKMEFHYFDDLDHSLNVGEYFVNGKLPAGHQAIFEFIKSQTRAK